MRRYLVVANQTLAGEHLTDKVKEYLAGGESQFHILVPATHGPEHMTWTEGQARRAAEQRLEQALTRFAVLGADVDGEVGDTDPLQAIADVLRREQFDEVILSTLPPGPSRWLKQDLPHRVERSFDVPVTHIIGEREPAPA
jgi:hypothetical protein